MLINVVQRQTLRVKNAACGILATMCAVALVVSLVPVVSASADEIPPKTTGPSIEELLEVRPFVEGEALVVYREDAAGRSRSAGPSNPFSGQGVAIEEAWDFSAPAEDAQAQEVPQSPSLRFGNRAANSMDANTAPEQEKIALVSKPGADTAALLKELEALDFVEVVSPNYLHDPIKSASLDSGEIAAMDESEVLGSPTNGYPDASLLQDAQDDLIASSPVLSVKTGDSPSSQDPLIGMQWAIENDFTLRGGSTLIDSSGNRTKDLIDLADQSGNPLADNIVAVVDSGVDSTNEDLRDVMWKKPDSLTELPGDAGSFGYDFGDGDADSSPDFNDFANSHGTHCAGIIAASMNNKIGISGVAPRTQIMALKIASGKLGGSFSDRAIVSSFAYIYQARLLGQNIVAVNNSWGGGATSPVVEFAVEQLGRAGVLSVFSAGNSNGTASNSGAAAGGGNNLIADAGVYGTDSPYALSVAATSVPKVLSSYTTYHHSLVDVAAPGSTMLSTVTDGAQAYLPAVAAATDAANNTSKPHSLYYHNLASLYDKAGGKPVPGVSVSLWERNGEGYSKSDRPLSLSTDRGIDGREALRFDIEQVQEDDQVRLQFTIDNPFFGKEVSDLENVRMNVLPSVVVNEGSVANRVGVTQADIKIFVPGDNPDELVNIVDTANSVATMANTDNTTVGSTALAKEHIELATETSKPLLVSVIVSAQRMKEQLSDGAVALTDFGIGFTEGLAYGYMSGTSMAAPYVAGSVALLASLHPDESPLDIRGRIVGGVKPLNGQPDSEPSNNPFPLAPGLKGSNGEPKRTAQQGALSLPIANNDAALHASTWGASLVGADEAGTETLALEGYALTGATLSIDGKAIQKDAFTVDQSGKRILLADESLMDGARHTVVVETGGMKHEANYAFPQPAAKTFEKVVSLPSEALSEIYFDKGLGLGTTIAAADRMFFVDNYGAALYSIDPQSSDVSWKQCQSPKQAGFDNSYFSSFTQGAYANGKLYLIVQKVDTEKAWSESVPYTLMVGALSYDIATNAWADEPLWMFKGGSSSLAGAFSPVGISSRNGAIFLSVGSGAERAIVAYDPTAQEASTKALSGEADQEQAIPKTLEGDLTPLFQIGEDVVFATVLPADTQGNMYGVGALLFDGNTFRTTGVSPGSPLGPRSSETAFLGEYLKQGVAATGDSLVFAGMSAKGLGDTYALNVADGTWSSLGVAAPGEDADKSRLFSACFYRGNYYALGAGKDAEGKPETVLYRMPEQVAETFAANDFVAEASAGEGGSVTVTYGAAASARTAQASSQAQQVDHVMVGDSIAWDATPAEGFVFEGWYDKQGGLVSGEAHFEQAVVAHTSLQARFVAGSAPNPPSPPDPSSPPSPPSPPAADDSGTATPSKEVLASTGDVLGIWAALAGAGALLSAAALLWLSRRRYSR